MVVGGLQETGACESQQEDFKRHKHTVYYEAGERVIVVKWDGVDQKQKREEQLKTVRELAELLVTLTSKFKVQAISIQMDLAEWTSVFIGALYVANHKVHYKARLLRNIQKTDQAEFDKMQQDKYFEATFCQLKRVNILGFGEFLSQDAMFAKSTILAKNMGSLRANMGSTTAMTRICTQIAEEFQGKVEVEVIAGESLVERGMNLIHAVGRANSEPPALVDLVYRGAPGKDQMVSLIGKGITFDTGGLNIKVALME